MRRSRRRRHENAFLLILIFEKKKRLCFQKQSPKTAAVSGPQFIIKKGGRENGFNFRPCFRCRLFYFFVFAELSKSSRAAEASAVWSWSNYLQSCAEASGRRVLALNLDETSISAIFTRLRGNVAEARETRGAAAIWLGVILAQALFVCMHACMSHFSSGPFWLRHCMHVCMHACPILAQGQFGSGSVCMYACMSHFASGAFWLRHCMDVCMHACPVLAWRNFGSGTVSMYVCMHVPFWVGAI